MKIFEVWQMEPITSEYPDIYVGSFATKWGALEGIENQKKYMADILPSYLVDDDRYEIRERELGD